MGGNGSYSKQWCGVPQASRTHIDTGFRIGGHKVLLYGSNTGHNKIIMNSNSRSPIYLFASLDKKTGKVSVSGIGAYKNHALSRSIDLKFDSDGLAKPFNKGEGGSHSHKWQEISPGVYGRKSHDKNNHLSIPKQYKTLIRKIENFNKKGKQWKKGKD